MSSIKNECPPSCPKVKKQIRAIIAEAPWLLDDIFPARKNDVDFQLMQEFISRDMQDESKREIEPADISKDYYDEEIVMDVALETEDVKPSPTQKQEIIEEQPIIQESEIVQESRITQESLAIPIKETDDEKINMIEEKKLMIERIIAEPAKEDQIVIDKVEIVEKEINQTVASTKLELEPPWKSEAYFQPEEHVEHDEEEEDITDYEKFIDEKLRETLPITITKEIPEEPEIMHPEISKDVAISYKEINRKEVIEPSREREVIPKERKVETEVKEVPIIQIVSREPARVPVSAVPEDACVETCPLLNEQREHIMRKLKERQQVVDHYYLTRGFSYFEDVCTCSLACVLYTLSRDQFVRNIFASIALFAIGLKLCSELDAWELPNRVS